jgi:hypothetical protein
VIRSDMIAMPRIQPTRGSSASPEHNPAMMSRSTIGTAMPDHFATAQSQPVESAAVTTKASAIDIRARSRDVTDRPWDLQDRRGACEPTTARLGRLRGGWPAGAAGTRG